MASNPDAWSRKKRLAFEEAFRDFLGSVYINSKDHDEPLRLSDHIYDAQERVLQEILDGLEQGIRHFFILKSRQLGCSTFVRAITLFWLGYHRGLKGAMVFDSDGNKASARKELEEMVTNLPPRLGFPAIASGNRDMLTFGNQSRINMLAAGKRATKTNKGLGASLAISFAHCCMAPGTQVLIDDGRALAIEHVPLGAKVLTHTGAEATVIANIRTENPGGRMIRIVPWLGQEVLCTPEHKIPTRRGMVLAGELRKDDWLVMPRRRVTHEVESITLPVRERKLKNHGGRVSVGEGATMLLTREVGFFVGYYLAEGSVRFTKRNGEMWPNRLVFSRHREEAAYARRAIEAVSDFITENRGEGNLRNSLTTHNYVYGSALTLWVLDTFSHGDSKFIPDDVFTWGEEFCHGLLDGLLSGDGSKGLYGWNVVQLTATRASIIFQARDLAAALGYGWAATWHTEGGLRYGRNCKPAWHMRWSGEAAEKLRTLLHLPLAPSSTRASKYIMEEDRVLLPVRSLGEVVGSEEVYDLSVDHSDHTFRTTHFSTSNSEMCDWGSAEGLTAFRQCFSEKHPNRLYIWESTARGYDGVWADLWEEAKADEGHSKCIFLGWYLKPSQKIERDHPDFEKYGVEPPSPKEREMIETVAREYDWKITPEQLAWYRRKMNPSNEDVDYDNDSYRLQEQPSTELEAFQMTGAQFFDTVALTTQAHENATSKFKGFYFSTGLEFFDMRVFPSTHARNLHFKVWEEPTEDAVYILSADVAFGSSERNDRSAFSVLRCYADGVDQVAEYAWPLINTRQYAWVISAVAGWYTMHPRSSLYLIMEINGPGGAVLNELKALRQQIAARYKAVEFQESGLTNIFRNVYNYFYSRTDSLSPGQSMMWKTNTQLKVEIMERLRDFVTNGMLRLRSFDTLDEMKRVAREGDSIAAQGAAKDDRVMALAMGIRMWDDAARRRLVAERRTRAAEEAKKGHSVRDQANRFNDFQFEQFFARKSSSRRRAMLAARQEQWRKGR